MAAQRRTRPEGYADVHQDYRAAEWTPVPLPRGWKKPPPKDVTGDTERRYDPGPADYGRWAAESPDGNVALVMPRTVIGIDVDEYAGGGETRDELTRKHGGLPVTWESTSRADLDRSGIALYRVPSGARLVGMIDPGIQIVQYHHRYVVCWPSIHPEGRMYEWWLGTKPAGIPDVSALPELPGRWLRGLAARAGKSKGRPYDGDVGDWLDALPAGRLPARVRVQLQDAERSFSRPGGRYDTMVAAVARLVHLGAEGVPVSDAVIQLGDMYCAAVDGERDGEAEFWRAAEGAVAKFGGDRCRRRWPTAPWVSGCGAS
jgi:hypothetical protein